MTRQRFVVIVELARGDTPHRAFGPYRTFRHASGDAKIWDGFVLPLEPEGTFYE